MDPYFPDQALPPSMAVVTRIANYEGVTPLDLPPLYEAIDPDALDGLVEIGTQNASALEIEFTYTGYEVTVTGDGVVHVEEASLPRASA